MKWEVVRSIVMKENIVQKLTSKDDKYACAFTDRIVAESHDMISSTLLHCGMLKRRRRQGNTSWICKIIPTGSISFISWLSYDSLNLELPDGNLYFAPIINWGKYREENGRLVMPVTVRLNHAIADGYLVSNVFRLLEQEITSFVEI